MIRSIFLSGEVDSDMFDQLFKEVKELLNASNETIEVFITTEGGDTELSLGIYSFLKSLPCPVVTIGVGKVMSAGTIIFLAGDNRMLLPYTSFMIHTVSTHIGYSKPEEVSIDLKYTESLIDAMVEIYKKHNKKSSKWWRKVMNQDTYFSHEELRELGLINHPPLGD